MKFKKEPEEKIVEVSNDIKDVVGYVWNNNIYKTKIEAAKARAIYKLEKLFPIARDIYTSYIYVPNNTQFVDNYEEVLKIIEEIK